MGINSGISVVARLNGINVGWASLTASPPIRCLPYRTFMGAVGDTSGILARNVSISREYKPVTANTKMFAGDSDFGGVYSSESLENSVIRGTMIARPWRTEYSYVLGIAINGLALPALDIELPKGYAITKVARTYNDTTNSTTVNYKHVVVSYPLNAPPFSTSTVFNAIPAEIRARDANTNFTSTELAALSNVVDIAAGNDCFFAIKNNTYSATQGSLVAWGNSNSDGVLTVPSGSTYTMVSARDRHAAALKADGSIVCWGNNTNGQCNAPSGTGFTMVACGDTFTAAINSAGKIVCWGSINTVPAPYSSMTFSSVSCGINHIVGIVAANYSEVVPGGIFQVSAGDVIAFGDNSKGQCNIPGFVYGPGNAGISGPAVAGGNFTAFECNTIGFKATEYSGGSAHTFAFTEDYELNRTLGASPPPATDLGALLEGYEVHRAGALCPMPLDKNHPWAINPPASGVTFNRDSVPTTIQTATGYTQIFNLISNATNVPTAFRRGGTKKAKLIAAGRYAYYKQQNERFAYGAGYSVIVGIDNQITVFGGDLQPSNCSLTTYAAPAETFALRNLLPANLSFDDTLLQLDTYRGQIFALKSSGDLAQWGYDDVSVSYNPEFYRINPTQKQYFSVPDDSLRDVLPLLVDAGEFPNLALSYVSGIPGLTPSWAVDVFLDRYFNGTRTTVRRFTATGKTPEYSIQSPVHFAETFLALDTWPGTATGLDSQYVLSVVPYGVSCAIN
jgi:hypothetical protein